MAAGWLLAVCAILIALNGLFVLMEYALVKVRSSRLELLVRRGDPAALRVQEIHGRLDDYLAAIQLGMTVVALALGWLGEPTIAAWVSSRAAPLAARLGPRGLAALSFAAALILLSWIEGVFGELVPRAIGLQKAELVALWGARPLQAFALALRLPVSVMSWCSKSILRLLGLKPAAQVEATFSEEEMRVLIGETQEKGSLPLERLLLLENLFDLGSAKVAEAMTPREKAVFLSLKKPWEENLETIRSHRFSRYPLCEDGLDTAVGMVHVKDLVLKGDGADLKHVRRELAEVSDTDALEKLIKYFPDKGIHMALARNALGRIVGLITMEDIVEELIGEVHDEFDLPQAWSLMDVVAPQAVAVGLQAADRADAIRQLLARLRQAAPELDEQECFRVVWDREQKFSSGVGRGVAVPHGRLLNLPRPWVAVGRFAKQAGFPSPDNIPVRLVFLILTPAATPVVQLKVLGRIAAIVTNENLRRRLLRAKTAEAMLEILRTADTLLA